MIRDRKTQIIDRLSEVFAKCSIGILTDYRGLSTSELTDLRRKLRESGVDYKVVKNTLARFAAQKADRDERPTRCMFPDHRSTGRAAAILAQVGASEPPRSQVCCGDRAQ